MTNTLLTEKKEVPTAFRQYNETKYQRTLRLTRQAIARLQADNQKVTLATIAEATKMIDETGKGITSTTILRNPDAAALFRQHSPAYQAKQQTLRQACAEGSRSTLRQAQEGSQDATRPVPPPSEDEEQIPATYRGLNSTDLIRRIENLKRQVAGLKRERNKLKAERDEAYRQRDEALRQNTQQLARLTQLTSQTGDRND